MTSSAQLLVVSPDVALVQVAQRCIEALGHQPLVARSLTQARRVLARAQVAAVCLDSVLSADDLEQLGDSLRDDHTTQLIFVGPASVRLVPASLPSSLRRRIAGVVTKPVDAIDFMREVSRVLSGRLSRGQRDDLVRAGSLALDAVAHELYFAEGGPVALTPIEARLVACLMERPGEFVATEDLLREVWGYPVDHGGPEVVRAHVSNVRRKLRQAGHDPLLVRTLPYHGYGFFANDAA